MGDIVQFNPKAANSEPEDTLIWVCRCGCQTFRLRSDSRTECASCGRLGEDEEDGMWRKRLPEAPANPQPVDSRNVSVVSLDSPALVRARLISRFTAPDADPALLVTAMRSGAVSLWSIDAETPEQDAWLLERLEIAKGLLAKPA